MFPLEGGKIPDRMKSFFPAVFPSLTGEVPRSGRGVVRHEKFYRGGPAKRGRGQSELF